MRPGIYIHGVDLKRRLNSSRYNHSTEAKAVFKEGKIHIYSSSTAMVGSWEGSCKANLFHIP